MSGRVVLRTVVKSSLCGRGELEILHADEFVARVWRQIEFCSSYLRHTHTLTLTHVQQLIRDNQIRANISVSQGST